MTDSYKGVRKRCHCKGVLDRILINNRIIAACVVCIEQHAISLTIAKGEVGTQVREGA